MDINTLAHRLEVLSKQYCQLYGIDRTPAWILLKLTEEVGELVQAYLQYSGQTRNTQTKGTAKDALENEVADALGMILLVAREFDLDIDAGLERKWLRHTSSNPALIATMNGE